MRHCIRRTELLIQFVGQIASGAAPKIGGPLQTEVRLAHILPSSVIDLNPKELNRCLIEMLGVKFTSRMIDQHGRLASPDLLPISFGVGAAQNETEIG